MDIALADRGPITTQTRVPRPFTWVELAHVAVILGLCAASFIIGRWSQRLEQPSAERGASVAAASARF